MRKFILIVTFLYFACITTKAQSWSGFGTGINGFNGPIGGNGVFALVEYDTNLYAGGLFNQTGGDSVNFIGKWNGASWMSLGVGLDGPVKALTVYNGNLIAGGSFTYSGADTVNSIAEWNGNSWSAIDKGMDDYDSQIFGLTVYNGNLIACGSIDIAGGTPVNSIAQWNGTSWSPLGTGINLYWFSTNLSKGIVAVTVSNGKLYAGGYFDTAGGKPANSIAEWDGTSWSALGSGVNYQIMTLVVYNGNIIAGGYFDSAGGKPANHIAEWNGISWSVLGAGVNYPVLSLTVVNNNLYAGGEFDSSGGTAIRSVAEWNGTDWLPLGAGMNLGGAVNALVSYNNNLVAGGAFDSAGGKQIQYVAEWCQGACVTGINEISADSKNINILPNPSSGLFTLQSNIVNVSSVVEIYNMLGEKVYASKLNAGNTQIDLSGNAAGIYLYRTLTESGDLISTGKLVIQK